MAHFLGYVLLLTFGSIMTCFAEADNIHVKLQNKTCNDALRELGDTQSKFVFCTIRHSMPAKSCTVCFPQYGEMTKNYAHVVANCSDLYINQNRLNVVYTMEKILVDIWNRAFCCDCFESNSTTEFNQLKIAFDNCIDDTQKPNKCEECKGDYVDLNNFYKKMEEEKGEKICFDIQDAMNRTRSTWSKDLKCCHREYSLALFIVASCLFGAIPFVFYLGMYGYTKRMERNHEVIDSNYNTETQQNVASTSAGVLSGISASPQREPELSTSVTAAKSINEVKKNNIPLPEKQGTSTQENTTNLIVI